MREQLIQYVNLLFAGAPGSEEIRQEILQNTLDRYDDLMAQGKSPEAAYRLAISGIGDINEILGSTASPYEDAIPYAVPAHAKTEEDTPVKKIIRAVAVGLYILCALPLIVLSDMGMDNLGLCGTLAMVAVATVLMILAKKNEPEEKKHSKEDYENTPKGQLRKSISNVVWAIGLAVYFIVSFDTNAWAVTWLIFPLIGSVQGLINACLDLKEAK